MNCERFDIHRFLEIESRFKKGYEKITLFGDKGYFLITEDGWYDGECPWVTFIPNHPYHHRCKCQSCLYEVFFERESRFECPNYYPEKDYRGFGMVREPNSDFSNRQSKTMRRYHGKSIPDGLFRKFRAQKNQGKNTLVKMRRSIRTECEL